MSCNSLLRLVVVEIVSTTKDGGDPCLDMWGWVFLVSCKLVGMQRNRDPTHDLAPRQLRERGSKRAGI